MPDVILALDSGRDRVGVALLDSQGGVLDRRRIQVDCLADEVAAMLGENRINEIALGSGTGAGRVREVLEPIAQDYGLPLVDVDEEDTTIRGRQLYLETAAPLLRPFRFLALLFGHPVDDWAAVVIGRRHLNDASP